ncbi:hypothetical protein [Streptomyces sp. NPDC006446]|uniref:hypothetical protein n=1 Tax=Streptomyces sp. NPDC006446 TaxID=3154301 RepID=UPI0033A53876
MTLPALPLPGPQRPVFFANKLLSAADLTAQQAVEADLRQLHHRMLHGWGIAQGLEIAGARGATQVRVGAGYAIDAAGRELVLPEPLAVPVPPVAAGPDGGPVPYALIVRWTEDADAVTELRPGACGAAGAVRRSDAPTVAWLDPPAVRTGLDIVVADAEVRGCALAFAPDPARRRLLNPPPTPYAGCGATPAGETAWRIRASAGGRPWAAWTTVDTTEAGFGDIPVYLARVAGERLISAADSPTGRPALLDGTPYVEQPEVGRFRMVVPLVPGTAYDDSQDLDVNPQAVVTAPGLASRLGSALAWHIEWIGLQP